MKLFAVLLGGDHPRAKIEVHDVVFAVGESLGETYDQLRAGWFGVPQKVHIDAWIEAEGFGGYRFEFKAEAPEPSALRLFLINYGGYEKDVFGELHEFVFVIAHDGVEAKKLGKERLKEAWQQPHVDAVMDVEACLPVEVMQGRHLHLVPGEYAEQKATSEYIRIGKRD